MSEGERPTPRKQSIGQYVLGSNLGEGTFGVVRLGTHILTGEKVAVKVLEKERIREVADVERVARELRILKLMRHPHIVQLYEIIETPRQLYLIMEFCSGGELFDYIVRNRKVPEPEACRFFHQILAGVSKVHELHVVHRDLKPENLLLDEACNIKLADFGLSNTHSPGGLLKTACGSPCYAAPEMIAGMYYVPSLCDVWSCGVILFVLLCGYPPFNGESDNDISRAARMGVQADTFPPEDWRAISPEAIGLIKKLLLLDPSKRITVEQAVQDSWIKIKSKPAHDGHALVNLGQSFSKNMRKFQETTNFKKAALHVIARHVSDGDIKILRNAFLEMDENGDGLLSLAEMQHGIAKAGINIPDIKELFEKVDSDHSGVIDWTEFVAATLDRTLYLQEEVCWEAFRVFDRDGSGKISYEELCQLFQSQSEDGKIGVLSEEQIRKIHDDADTNRDGEIDFDEFMAMMRSDTVTASK